MILRKKIPEKCRYLKQNDLHVSMSICTTLFSFFPSHETPRAPQPNPQSSLIPKNN